MKTEFVEQYRKFNPLERNSELLGLYLLLPLPLYDEYPNDDDWISKPGQGRGIDEQDRRRKSETHHRLVDRHESLLTLSCTTVSLQAYLSDNYSFLFVQGFDRLRITTGGFGSILFKEHNINPGIFAPESGKEIERKLYRIRVFGKLEIQRNAEQMYKERGLEPPPFEETPDWARAIFAVNPNQRFKDSRKYEEELKNAELKVRQLRILLQRWPNEFFNMYKEEI